MDLLTANSVPPHAREAFILTGYRRPLESDDALVHVALRGIFSWHNQTANIWTHLIGTAWAVSRLAATTLTADIPDEAYRWAIACFHGSSACVLAISTTAHLLAPVVSPATSRQLWALDHSSIILATAGSFAPGLTYGFRCHPFCRAIYSAVVFGGLSVAGHLTVAVARPPATTAQRNKANSRRIIVLSAVGAFGLVPLCEIQDDLPPAVAFVPPSSLVACSHQWRYPQPHRMGTPSRRLTDRDSRRLPWRAQVIGVPLPRAMTLSCSCPVS